MRPLKTRAAAAAAAMLALTGAAQATPVFQGRLADGTASSSCTVSGAAKCTSFYDSNLDITILNNWSIGAGVWDGSATPAAGSAQAQAEAAGLAATGLTGWVLPTTNLNSVAASLNQFHSIWLDVGESVAGLRGQFDGAQSPVYWSSTEYAVDPELAWNFNIGSGFQSVDDKGFVLSAVAVRPGDVAASVPEPQTLALALLALGATVVARRRRAR